MPSSLPFRRRHPGLFWFCIVAAAMILFAGIMAALRAQLLGKSDSALLAAGGTKLGLVRIEGTIADPEKIVAWIRELREDQNVKGVVVRINSPGGVVGPSQEIYEAVKRLAKEKPVVASMGAVAASGGYYVASPATKILANPGTLTGSIGVKLQLVNASTLTDKLGLTFTSLTSGKFKDAGSPFKPLSDEDKAYFDAVVMDLKKQFVRDVCEGRKMDPAKIEPLADGRAFTGQQALDAGLIDKLGGLEDAYDLVKQLAKLEGKYPLRIGPKKDRSWLYELLEGSLGPLDPESLITNTVNGVRVSYE